MHVALWTIGGVLVGSLPGILTHGRNRPPCPYGGLLHCPVPRYSLLGMGLIGAIAGYFTQ